MSIYPFLNQPGTVLYLDSVGDLQRGHFEVGNTVADVLIQDGDFRIVPALITADGIHITGPGRSWLDVRRERTRHLNLIPRSRAPFTERTRPLHDSVPSHSPAAIAVRRDGIDEHQENRAPSEAQIELRRIEQLSERERAWLASVTMDEDNEAMKKTAGGLRGVLNISATDFKTDFKVEIIADRGPEVSDDELGNMLANMSLYAGGVQLPDGTSEAD
ncbi:hypothetical protein CcaverHIS002_0602660 [Cutaneotrichosporon cavernicola]|uniref:Uncharacterized protein n=1 Tax=Cutaneotrichosporon cavernicola TaxID=279322 RepID=A0AA48L8A8_9TREE|nr:uncharacterized protein CcaverHIS019_0602140 [Cutaneotrichosporon cavernicola]BEI85979.1 hypothetical protein CcaverHIS002_0602660 [Cutaneotrichosporon cavernicola]BEI93755.1 hypothetical protein CcaverHIS019_0602140 [Cutaneotrichosporon cavernicola]BEJ01533.1 hypothetical protein CcaverHIS631_0602150 [Cutaneotrichosporon cavernicola]BEJ09298.1 hypothetical protein CcaverHIS641_0602130 [Cutaneotrichosporon cavernicola]